MTTAVLPIPRNVEQRSPISRVALVLFVWILPFHPLAMAFLVGGLGWSAGLVRPIAAWKELAVVVLLAWAALRALTGRGQRTHITAPDIAVTIAIAIPLIFLLAENSIFAAGVPRVAELYGFRDTVMFMLLYYVGRAGPELATQDRVLKQLFFMGLVISAIAVLERIFISPDMLVLIGVATYMNEFLGLSAFTAGNEWGLPQNYWTWFGDTAVRRAGSVFLHSQGLALPFLLLMPAATALVLATRKRPGFLLRLGYVLLWVGLLLTISRVTIAICALQVVLYFALVRKPEWAAGTTVALLAGFAFALALVPGVAVFVWETLTWQTPSSVSHLSEWNRGTVAFFEQPWGHGLGTTEGVAARAGLTPITGDNMFLAYAVQLGILGLIMHLAVLLLVLAYAWRAFRYARVPAVGRLGITLVLATVGILVNGATSLVMSSTVLAYVFFLLAGSLVTAVANGAVADGL